MYGKERSMPYQKALVSGDWGNFQNRLNRSRTLND